MRVIVAGVDKGDVKSVFINNRLEDLQELVGGYIETCAPMELAEQGIELLCNEEGLLRGFPPNENLFPFFYVGRVVFVGVDGCDFCSLTIRQIEFIRRWLYLLV